MKLRSASLLAVPMLIVACSDDSTRPGGNGEPPPLKTIEKTSALAIANANLRSILVGSAQSSVFVDDAKLIGDIAGASGMDCASAPQDPSVPEPPPPTNCYDFSYEEGATSMSDRVAEKVLNIANIESEEPTKLVLKLIPERICDTDQPCIDAFNANPIRLEITSRADNNIDVGVLIGEARTNPIDLQLYANEIAVEVDLGAAKAAAENLMRAIGESSGELPSTSSGRVRFSIKKNAENNYSIVFAILSAIDVVMEGVSFHAGTANPAVKLDVDGNRQELDMLMGFGELRGEMPLSSMFSADAEPCTVDPNGNTMCPPPPDPVMGTVAYRLGALKWNTSVTVGASESAVIDGIDFGNGFAMTVDNQPFISADADLRTLELTSSEAGMQVAVSPSLVANVSLDFRSIADRVTEFPAWAEDDDITFELKGASKPALMVHDMTEALEVVAGSLMIRSRAAGRTVEVGAGMCLTTMDAAEGTTPHPVELLAEGTCP